MGVYYIQEKGSKNMNKDAWSVNNKMLWKPNYMLHWEQKQQPENNNKV